MCSTVGHHGSWVETAILENATRHKEKLKDIIKETTGLVDLLVSFQVLSQQEADEVKTEQMTVDQSQLIIDYVLEKSWIEVVKFVSALRRITFRPEIAECILEEAGGISAHISCRHTLVDSLFVRVIVVVCG
jgi:hypothetical protein